MSIVPDARVAGHEGASPAHVQSARSDMGTAHGVDQGRNRTIRLLVFTSLYPNAAQPRHGIFVEERLRHLVDSGRVAATVMAPVPWFPLRHRRFDAWATFARVPECEERYGIRVLHPRYPVIPKVGMNVAPSLMYRALLPVARTLVTNGTFDLIDAHYLYPDGVTAVRLGAAVDKPVVITARGSDVNVLPQYRSPARQIRWAATQAAAVVTVSQALKSKLAAMGATSGKLAVLRNGVDLDRFRPLGQGAIRTRLGLAGPVWLTVGHLVELKGVHLVIEALTQFRDIVLLIAGGGPEGRNLRSLARRLGVDSRVRFLGAIPQDDLCAYYNAADALFLASSREGMPNVVLESLACGTPVVAAPFESATELITAPEAGEVAEFRTPEAIAAAWRRLDSRRPERAATRRFAERFGWAPVVEAQCALYARVLADDKIAQGTAP
ncbi:MAG TPA: glycosyltransferase [Rhodanobacteraceae bacterium]|nr:glycosyltransferase [Rhodanobacteraceae bacterium]